MKSASIILDALKAEGYKLTKTRKRIVDILLQSALPISVPEIREGLGVNKTTVYRELEFLLQKNIIREVEFGDGKKRYEITTGGHHHHIVCLHCGMVEDVELSSDLEKEESAIAKKKQFKIINHSLEFFGICARC